MADGRCQSQTSPPSFLITLRAIGVRTLSQRERLSRAMPAQPDHSPSSTPPP